MLHLRSIIVATILTLSITVTITSFYTTAQLKAQLPPLPPIPAAFTETFKTSVEALSPYLFRHKKPASTSVHPSSPYYHAAYATFLSAPASNSTDPTDGYFLGARVLTHALLHHHHTKTKHSIPFLILVTPNVPIAFRHRLELDGATIIEVDHIHASWVKPGDPRWRDVLAKLHLFSITSYRKICFLDADTLVTGNLDGVFEDAATNPQFTHEDAAQIHADEAALPSSYTFAAHSEALGFYNHTIPPESHGYLNSGFFVLSPNTMLFNYYNSLLTSPSGPSKFPGVYPEQDLLNYAHRWNGNMPWQELKDWRWNVNWPIRRDYEEGAKSFHAKYWEPKGSGGHDDMLWEMWWERKREMEEALGPA